MDPSRVISPRASIGRVEIVYNGGSGGWSVALLEYNGSDRIGIRWNGDGDDDIGNPQSRGRATWFILPPELEGMVREQAEQLSNLQAGGLLAGYREMASDQEREAEALAWSEGLIADATSEKR